MIPPDIPLDALLRDLQERAKELNCLYRVEEQLKQSDRPLQEVLTGVVQAIPDGMQYPRITRARIVYADGETATPDFCSSPWTLSAPIIVHDQPVGRVDICYAEHVPPEAEGPFLKEERRLINSIADRIAFFLERKRLEIAYRTAQASDPLSTTEARPRWHVIVDFIRQTDEQLLQRVARKLLNHLCWSGVQEAVRLLHDLQPLATTGDGTDIGDVNQPMELRDVAETQQFADKTFAIAQESLAEDEVLGLLERWIKEDKSRFLVHTIGNPDSPLSEVREALTRFHHSGPEQIYINPSAEKGLTVALIEHFFTQELNFIGTAKRFLSLEDFYALSLQVLAPEGSHGKLGGKSAGLFLACNIVRKSAGESSEAPRPIKTPKTWYITSDGLLRFIQFNNLEEVYNQKYADIEHIRREYPHLVQTFKNSSFPPDMIQGLTTILDTFGDHPLIVRSSSLLEDRFGSAFSGKYKSLFLANCGTKKERLARLMDAIAEVYASTFAPDPIEYRTERGLLDVYEEMGIMIQEVVGTRVGDYFLPSFAGVAFSNNEFRWSSRIRREDGLLRLVPGLGTRAVDRVKDDYPVLMSPGQPGLRVNVSVDEVIRYSPKMVDVINLANGQFETIPLDELVESHGASYPGIRNILSIVDGDHVRRLPGVGVDFKRGGLVATFEGLVSGTPFMKQIHALLTLLKREMGTPVDIEFAHNGTDLYLLQCRPQSNSGDSAPIQIPKDIDGARVLFNAKRFVSNGRIPDITHIVYVDHIGYQNLGTIEDLKAIGRAVGRLNKILPKHQFILMGPGRWGSRGDIKLGVNVTYADINNTAVLIEIARRKQGYLPDLSFGTHFFQDLVEASIRYLPLYPDEDGIRFQERFFLGSESILPEVLPEFARYADTIRVIDVARVTDGHVLRIVMSAEEEEAIGYLATPGAVPDKGSVPTRSESAPPEDHWRWRLRFAERLAAEMDASQFGVKGVYVFGSTKNASAGPGSDIDLLIHFDGTPRQRSELMMWLQGWSMALAEMNYLRTGYRSRELLDIHIVTDEDIARRDSYAIKIGAVTDPARKLLTKQA